MRNGFNVLWAQLGSRQAEIDLTIRNFGYYLTDLRDSSWNSQIEDIIKLFPFSFLIVEVGIDNDLALERWKNKFQKHDENDLGRMKKTIKYFQPITLPVPYLLLDGPKGSESNVKTILDFINMKHTQSKKSHL